MSSVRFQVASNFIEIDKLEPDIYRWGVLDIEGDSIVPATEPLNEDHQIVGSFSDAMYFALGFLADEYAPGATEMAAEVKTTGENLFAKDLTYYPNDWSSVRVDAARFLGLIPVPIDWAHKNRHLIGLKSDQISLFYHDKAFYEQNGFCQIEGIYTENSGVRKQYRYKVSDGVVFASRGVLYAKGAPIFKYVLADMLNKAMEYKDYERGNLDIDARTGVFHCIGDAIETLNNPGDTLVENIDKAIYRALKIVNDTYDADHVVIDRLREIQTVCRIALEGF